MSKKLPHLIPKGRLQSIRLRFFATPALLILSAATLTEATISPMENLSWTSPDFLAFRLVASLSMNVLVFCLCFYLVRKKGTFDEMREEEFAFSMKIARPCLIATAIMAVADSVRVALLHPQSAGDTTSAWLFGALLVLSVALAKQRTRGRTAGTLTALIVCGVFSVFALLIFVIGWLADFSIL